MLMKRTFFTLTAVVMLAACNNASKQDAENKDTTAAQTGTPEPGASETKPASSSFDINNIPVSDKELGAFPFFSFPEGLEAQNKPLERKFDRIFFPLGGVMTPVEGRVFKTYVVGKNREDWSWPFFEKSYDQAITAAGGVKVFDAKVSNVELDRIKDKATYFGEEGSLDYWNEPVKVYIIRRADGGDVYIQFYGNSSSGAIQILQKEAFKQTITMLKADEIKKQIDEKGKAVLHINFDTDKATLKPDGQDAVSEIAKVLQADNNLKLAINGYTDNAGSKEHNLKLSKDRAATVLKAITAKGISESRLSSDGFGDASPIASNDNEDGKAQNRRVELVKK
jgi:outer membrane protein OmpA-like peptidoglycan-associated protein